MADANDAFPGYTNGRGSKTQSDISRLNMEAWLPIILLRCRWPHLRYLTRNKRDQRNLKNEREKGGQEKVVRMLFNVS